ncbi:MAG: ABC transporter substrate-binding protein [Nitrososphaerota archaeon]|nr:ABC transporter substrate-binding protein [Nitrososphaerota archaeon]
MLSLTNRRSAISRTIVVIVIVAILIVAAAAAVYASGTLGTKSATTSTTSSASTPGASTTSSSSSHSTTVSTTSSQSTTQGKQNITMEIPVATSAPGIYQITTNSGPENLLYDPLFNFNESSNSGTPIPWLATGYTVSANAQVWTINLRQGVTFTDGSQFNATSVKDDIEDIIFAGTNIPNFAPVIPYIRGAETYIASNHNSANRSAFTSNDGMTVLSPYSLQINLTKPKADLLTYFEGTLDLDTDVSPTAIQANGGITSGVGSNWLMSNSAGSGPYVLTSFTTSNGQLVFTANPNWWAISALGLKQPFYRITINVVSSISTEELDLRTGTTNIIQLPLSNVFDFANRTAWQQENKLVSTVSNVNLYGPYASPEFYSIAFNYQIHTSLGGLASVQPFQNQHLVQAINEAWNQTQFIQQDLNGFGIANNGIEEQGQVGYTNPTQAYPYNLTAAKQNLQLACQQLGCSPSNPLQILFISSNDQLAELAGSLLTSNVNSLQAGVILNFQPLSTSGKITDLLSRIEGITLYEQVSNPPDPLYEFSTMASPSGTLGGFFGFNQSSITSLINQAQQTGDLNSRIQIYQQLNQALTNMGAYPMIAQFDVVYATSSNIKLSSFNINSVNYFPPIESILPA